MLASYFFPGVLRAANSSTNCLDMVVPASLLYVYFDANHLVLPSVSLWAINFFFFCQMFLFPFAESCQKQEHAHHGSVKLGQPLDHPGHVLVPGQCQGKYCSISRSCKRSPSQCNPQCHSSNRWRVQYTDNTAGSPVVQSVYGDPGE